MFCRKITTVLLLILMSSSLCPQNVANYSVLLAKNETLEFLGEDDFDTIQEYNIVEISIYLDGKRTDICKYDGSIYGTLDFGRYRKNRYYFALQQDNGLARGITLFESMTDSPYSDQYKRGTKYIVKDMDDRRKDMWTCYLVEYPENGKIQFMVDGSGEAGQKDVLMTYTLRKK